MENQHHELFNFIKLFGQIIIVYVDPNRYKLFGVDLRLPPPAKINRAGSLQVPPSLEQPCNSGAKRSRELQISSRKTKKAKPENPPADDEVPVLPQVHLDELVRMGATVDDQNPKFIYKKKLTKSDIEKQQNRLTMHIKQSDEGFLTPEEIDRLYSQGELGKPYKMSVKVVDPKLVVRTMSLAKWGIPQDLVEMDARKKKGWFSLNNHWMEIVVTNEFKEGDHLQVWSFRIDGELGFLIYKNPDDQKKVEDDGNGEMSGEVDDGSGSSDQKNNDDSGSGSGGSAGSLVACA